MNATARIQRQDKPYWMIGRENFQHGAAAMANHREEFISRERHQDTMDANLLKSKMGQSQPKKIWSRAEMERLWHLRWEVTPRKTYDQLAKIFRRDDTWDIVNALTEMRMRKDAGIDMFAPYGISECSPKEIEKAKLMPKTKEYIRLLGEGWSYRQISESYGASYDSVCGAISRVKKKCPNAYNDLLDEGKRRKEEIGRILPIFEDYKK